MTNSWNTPIEAFEHQYPLRVESYRVRAGSRRRGRAPGRRRYRSRVPIPGPGRGDHPVRSPRERAYGLNGGEPGAPGRNTLLRRDGKTISLPARPGSKFAPVTEYESRVPGGAVMAAAGILYDDANV